MKVRGTSGPAVMAASMTRLYMRTLRFAARWRPLKTWPRRGTGRGKWVGQGPWPVGGTPRGPSGPRIRTGTWRGRSERTERARSAAAGRRLLAPGVVAAVVVVVVPG